MPEYDYTEKYINDYEQICLHDNGLSRDTKAICKGLLMIAKIIIIRTGG